MFDRTIINESHSPSRIDHHYHKQSTAEDLRLLRGMRDEVEREFAEHRAINNTCTQASMFRSMVDQSVMVCLKLNGQDLSFKVYDQELWAEKNLDAVIDVVARAIARELAINVAITATQKEAKQ